MEKEERTKDYLAVIIDELYGGPVSPEIVGDAILRIAELLATDTSEYIDLVRPLVRDRTDTGTFSAIEAASVIESSMTMCLQVNAVARSMFEIGGSLKRAIVE